MRALVPAFFRIFRLVCLGSEHGDLSWIASELEWVVPSWDESGLGSMALDMVWKNHPKPTSPYGGTKQNQSPWLCETTTRRELSCVKLRPTISSREARQTVPKLAQVLVADPSNLHYTGSRLVYSAYIPAYLVA